MDAVDNNNVWLWLILGNQVVELQGRIGVTILHVWHNPLPLLRLFKGEALLSWAMTMQQVA